MNFTGRLLYRGKAKDGGQWVFGRPQKNSITGKWYIHEGRTATEVDPNTISQSTGKSVKGNTMVFEGDTLLVAKTEKVTVVWDDELAGFDTKPRITYASWSWHEATVDHSGRLEIIGNQWDGEEKAAKRKAAAKPMRKKPSPIIEKFAVNQMYDSNDKTIVYAPQAICGPKKEDKHIMGLFIFPEKKWATKMVKDLNALCPIALDKLATKADYKLISQVYKPMSKDYDKRTGKVYSRSKKAGKVVEMDERKPEEPKSKQYPIRDGHRRHYVQYPISYKGKWVAVNVLLGKKGGYMKPELTGAHQFKTEAECQKGCDIHNDWHFGIKTVGGQTYVADIIAKSFELSRKNEEKEARAKVKAKTAKSTIDKPMGTITTKSKPRLA
jgi:hypothetical protein